MKTVWSNQANGGERRYMTMINREKFPWLLLVLNLLGDLESWWVFETCSVFTATWEIVQLDYRFSLGWNHQLDHCSPRYIVRLKTLIINTTWFLKHAYTHPDVFLVPFPPDNNFPVVHLDAACCVRFCVCVCQGVQHIWHWLLFYFQSSQDKGEVSRWEKFWNKSKSIMSLWFKHLEIGWSILGKQNVPKKSASTDDSGRFRFCLRRQRSWQMMTAWSLGC